MLDNNNIKKEDIIKHEVKHEVKDEVVELSVGYDNIEQNNDNTLNTGSLGVPGKCYMLFKYITLSH